MTVNSLPVTLLLGQCLGRRAFADAVTTPSWGTRLDLVWTMTAVWWERLLNGAKVKVVPEEQYPDLDEAG